MPGHRVTLHSDVFDRADSNPASGPYTRGSAYSGSGFADAQIVGQKMRGTSTTTDNAMVLLAPTQGNPIARNQFITIVIGTKGAGSSEFVGILRMAEPFSVTGYFFVAAAGESTTSRITAINAGTPSDLITENATTWLVGDELGAEIETDPLGATTLRLYRNGRQLLAISDATIVSGRLGWDIYNDTAVGNAEIAKITGGELQASPLSFTRTRPAVWRPGRAK